MKRNGAQIITTLIERQGIDTVTGIPGGANLPLYDALQSSNIRHILARHEQGAGFIAQGMARVTGKAQVCLGTSGPGATNLLTAIADAKLDSIPLVAITGQVPSAMIGTDAFQEVDTYGLTLPITKHNFMARSAAELLKLIPLAFELAESGRPGPIVVDVPKDIFLQETEFDAWPEPWVKPAPDDIPEAKITPIAEAIREAQRPLLYVGGGIIASNSAEDLQTLARKNNIPVTTTLMGLGVFPPEDSLSLGMLGMHGARYTNMALDEADLILAFGVRFDDRATGKVSAFCPNARIVHVDIDPSEISKIKPAHLSIAGDVGQAIRALIPQVDANPRSEWTARIAELKQNFPFEMPPNEDPMQPVNLLAALGNMLNGDTVVSTDVGQHQMWAAQILPFRHPRSFLTSGGLGTMGFGLPAAIGAALGRPHARVVCISGDGSFFMNMQELSILAELNLPVTILILNNRRLGLVRQQQELFYGERYHASQFHNVPDFVALAQAFGIEAFNLGDADDPIAALAKALESPGPCLIEAPIDPMENVFPMVAPGAANSQMITQSGAKA